MMAASRILWSYIMKNFQAKHGQCDSIIFSKTFSFESSKSLLNLCLANSRILYFWHVLESIHKFIIELHVLQCLFVREFNKKGGVGSFQISQKERFFHLLWQKKALESNLTKNPQKKNSSSPLQLGQEKNVLGHSVERRGYWFVLKIARTFSISTSRNSMMNTFIIVNITPACKRQFTR